MVNEKRLIDANALATKYRDVDYETKDTPWTLRDILFFLEKAPTVDAVEVVHGRWVLCQDDGCEWYECSSCRTQPLNDNAERPVLSDYCPNCGAKMDGGNDNIYGEPI